MKTLLLATSLFLPAAAASQTEPSEAERAFREGWWHETGKGAVKEALSLYVQAAAAAGPEAVRARALLRAGNLKYRLGKTAEAIQLLERVVRDFARQGKQVAAARDKLTEWTAVDLRRNFSEWYRKHRFSPEYQKQVVATVTKLGTELTKKKVRELRSELLSIGEAAVPALREALRSRNPSLVNRAAHVLLLLGEVPPAAPLLTAGDWASDADAWRSILTMSGNNQRRLAQQAGAEHNGVVGKLLQAAASGPVSLIEALAGEVGASLATLDDEITEPIVEALHAIRNKDVHARLIDLGRPGGAPLRIRRVIEEVIGEHGWRGAGAAKWLSWSRTTISFEMRRTAVYKAASLLRSGDGEVLDAMLADLESVGKPVRPELAQQMIDGLRQNGVPLRVPWTSERLARWLRLVLPEQPDLGHTLANLRRDPERRKVLIAALTDDAKLPLVLDEHDMSLSDYLRDEDSEAEAWLAESAWGKAVGAHIRQRWGKWSPASRAGVIRMLLKRNLIERDHIDAETRKFLRATSQREDEATRALLAQLLADDK